MGAGSSHPVPVKPIIDYRLVCALPTRKTRDGYEITAAVPSGTSTVYRALIPPKLSKADIELSHPAFPKTPLGSVRFIHGGGDKSRIEVTFGEGGYCQEMERMKHKTYAFSYGKAEYVWKITSSVLFGGVKEMVLRVRVEGDGKEDEEDGGKTEEGKTEEEGGEIVGLWKVKTMFNKVETGFWIKRSSVSLDEVSLDEAKGWQNCVLLTGLAVIVGSQRK